MSALCSLRSHSPLKTLFGQIGDTYQAYCHTYKTHAMATCHAGSGQTLDRDINAYYKNKDSKQKELKQKPKIDYPQSLQYIPGFHTGPESEGFIPEFSYKMVSALEEKKDLKKNKRRKRISVFYCINN